MKRKKVGVKRDIGLHIGINKEGQRWTDKEEKEDVRNREGVEFSSVL